MMFAWFLRGVMMLQSTKLTDHASPLAYMIIIERMPVELSGSLTKTGITTHVETMFTLFLENIIYGFMVYTIIAMMTES
jgi:hypothetical protein